MSFKPTIALASFVTTCAITRVRGRRVRCDVGPKGDLDATIETSFEDVRFKGHCHSLELDVRSGDWVEARLQCRPGRPLLWLVRAKQTRKNSGWVPGVICHRGQSLCRLQGLLATLSASVQAFFVEAMADAAIQSRWFKLVAAVDHHVYPGGLFDQSVSAAELASKIEGEHREAVVLAALLCDAGKLFDATIRRDFGRGAVPRPHPMTHLRVVGAHEPTDDRKLAATVSKLLLPVGLPDGADDLRAIQWRIVRASWMQGEANLRLDWSAQ